MSDSNNKTDVLSRMRKKMPLVSNSLSKDISLAQFADYWLKYLTPDLKKSTRFSYQSAVKNHINRVFLSMKLSEITPEDVQLFIMSLVEGEDLEDPLSPKTIRNIHGVLHKCFQAAYELKIITENPAKHTTLPKLKKPEIIPMNNDELTAFLNTLTGHPLEVFFKLAVLTGMRKSELIGLTWDCFNFEEGSIRVYRQLSCDKDTGKYFFDSVKNGKPRVIYPAPDIMRMMKQYYNSMPCSGYVFRGLTGSDHLLLSQVRTAFEKITNSLNMSEFRFHDLRHTYAVICIKAGVDLKTLSEAMGHHSVAFTLDTYAFALTDMKREGAKRVQTFMNNLNIEI